MTKAERIEMMRKRQAYFSAIAEEYVSFADFIKAQDMWGQRRSSVAGLTKIFD